MPEQDTAGHEQRDLDARAILWFAVGLVVTLLIVFVAIAIFHAALARHDHGQVTTAPRSQPPLPRLQTDPAADLAHFRAAEEAQLNSYGWVDRGAGVIRIPIDRAIDLTLERGLPARPVAKGAAP